MSTFANAVRPNATPALVNERQNGRPLVPTTGKTVPLGISDVTIEGGFWARLQDLNAEVMIAHAQEWMERLGWIGNFDAAVEGRLPQDRHGREFSDSDVYKLMEAMAWEVGRTGNADMDARFQALTARIAPVQEDDGYLNTKFGRPGQAPRYTDFEWGHELYCYGHMIQAAVARLRTSGVDDFVGLTIRAANHVCDEFGAQGRHNVPGHPVLEMALVELSRATGDPRYLEQARLFVERRGHHALADIEWGREYYQDDVPVRQARIARGHAVRAMYLAAGATDVAVDTGDAELLGALVDQARNTLARRTYLTGGMGSRHTGEAFGLDFELSPDRAYSETCAGIGAIQYFQRLLLATGDPMWADHVERILFNVVATSPRHDGRAFFYSNTLFAREEGAEPPTDVPSPRAESSLRAPWYDVSCCPTNVARTLASLGSYIAAVNDGGVYINQYAGGTVECSLPGGRVCLALTSNYPNDGEVRILVEEAPEGPWDLSVRVPGWARGATIDDGSGVREVEPGYAVVPSASTGAQIVLRLPVKAQWVWPDPRIDAVRGQVAVQRGPIVYCLESVDFGSDVKGAFVDTSNDPIDEGGAVSVMARALSGADSVWPYGDGGEREYCDPGHPTPLIAYHSWANRGPGTMRVWMPVLG